MIDVVPFAALGRMNIGWLDAHYHFSFADYFDPARMGFGPLRVWNDDRIRPGAGGGSKLIGDANHFTILIGNANGNCRPTYVHTQKVAHNASKL